MPSNSLLCTAQPYEVALKEFLAQLFEAWGLRVHGEGHGDHRLGTAGNLIANMLRR